MRGTRPVTGSMSISYRITPACAGNTIPHSRCLACNWDHPRLCGEHSPAAVIMMVVGGSPPPVRGTRCGVFSGHAALRITPACAGNTSTGILARIGRWDHPRLCGEHPNSPIRAIRSSGSPPPVRGTRSNSLTGGTRYGITPACAGNTLPCSRSLHVAWDHPRLCGEHQTGG